MKKKVQLVHNPTAGDEEHEAQDLIALLQKEGYACEYTSANEENWPLPDSDTGLIAVVGGDGTIRQVAKALVQGAWADSHLPLAVIPCGTANNIAKSLGISAPTRQIVQSWSQCQPQPFDIGKVEGLSEEAFFMEAFGFGLFPDLMDAMKTLDKPENPSDELTFALEVLHELIEKAKPCQARLTIDGKVYEGNYLLLEVMNIRSIGPNLALAPNADWGDGAFEVVLVSEEDRNVLAKHVLDQSHGIHDVFPLPSIMAREIRIEWAQTNAHCDDERIEALGPVQLQIQPGRLQVLR